MLAQKAGDSITMLEGTLPWKFSGPTLCSSMTAYTRGIKLAAPGLDASHIDHAHRKGIKHHDTSQYVMGHNQV